MGSPMISKHPSSLIHLTYFYFVALELVPLIGCKIISQSDFAVAAPDAVVVVASVVVMVVIVVVDAN